MRTLGCTGGLTATPDTAKGTTMMLCHLPSVTRLGLTREELAGLGRRPREASRGGDARQADLSKGVGTGVGGGGGAGPVPAGTVAGVAGAAAGPRASARRAPLARVGGIAGRAGGGPGREETASEGPAELCRACPVCPAFYSAGLQAFLLLEARQRNQALT